MVNIYVGITDRDEEKKRMYLIKARFYLLMQL